MNDSLAEKGFLAGEKGQRHHGLAGLPLGSATGRDELLHPPVPSGHFSATETSYYGFSIPERRLNGEIYLWFHPVLKVMSASIYIWTGMKSSSLACEYVSHHHYLPWPTREIDDFTVDAVGLRIEVLKPLQSIRISFDDDVRNVHLSYQLDAIMPAGMRPGGYHFTQAMRTSGHLRLYGETLTIDGFFSRDRSWGQERREDPLPFPPMTWMVGIFNPEFAFHVLALDDPGRKPEWCDAFPDQRPGENVFWGYLWLDGKLTSVRAASKLTTRESDGLAPRLFDMELVDELGRTLALQGTVQARMPWQTWQSMNTFFCQTRWETNGHVGYGDAQDVQFEAFTRRYAR